MTGAATQDLEATTMRRVGWRLVPFVILAYFIAFVDRVNIGFAALHMNRDLGLSAAAFGFGSGLFFLSYALLEVPSNLIMQRVGARLWLARIMITWGLISGAMALVVGPYSLYTLRLLLGAAEAGFFPGVILYLTYWFPSAYRGRVVAWFMVAIPVSSLLGSPLSALLLQTDGWLGVRGWQWLFILEAAPAVLLGMTAWFVLPDRPADARWLTPAQRDWLVHTLEAEQRSRPRAITHPSVWKLFTNKHVLVACILCGGSAGVSQCLAIWQPQILKSFGLTDLQTGWVNAIPYALASVLMIWWGRRSDRRDERLWHTVGPLSLVCAGLAAAVLTTALLPTVIVLCAVLIGVYTFKGPFWALATDWLSHENAAAGVALINAVGAVAAFVSTWLLGLIKDATGSYPLGLLPMAAFAGLGVVLLLSIARAPAHQAER